ncbi:unnamed protein product [Ectocarpus fasciculatus]
MRCDRHAQRPTCKERLYCHGCRLRAAHGVQSATFLRFPPPCCCWEKSQSHPKFGRSSNPGGGAEREKTEEGCRVTAGAQQPKNQYRRYPLAVMVREML